MLSQLCNALEGKIHLIFSLKVKRLCNNADSKYAHLLGNLSYNRSCTRTGTAAHTCRNENKRCTFENFLNIISVLFCRLCSNRRVSACTTASCSLSSYLYTLHCAAVFCLKGRDIGIYNNKVNAFYIVSNHVFYCVSAAAANADNLYLDITLKLFFIEIKVHFSIPPYFSG